MTRATWIKLAYLLAVPLVTWLILSLCGCGFAPGERMRSTVEIEREYGVLIDPPIEYTFATQPEPAWAATYVAEGGR